MNHLSALFGALIFGALLWTLFVVVIDWEVGEWLKRRGEKER